MTDTLSTMLDLGTEVPDFELPDVITDRSVSLGAFRGKKGVVIVFMCNHCPAVKNIKIKLVDLAKNYSQQIGFVGINANDYEEYPQDNPENMLEDAKNYDYPFPYLVDKSQQTAKAYRAACTPDIFLINEDRQLIYRGQFDDSRPGNGKPVTGKDLEEAILRLLNGEAPVEEQIPSLGCNIKWKPGNEPNYFD